MHCAQKMTHNIYWIGSNDWTTERFENLFPIPNGVSYNSYFIDDEKTCVVDSVDAEIREEYFDNLTHLLNGRELDYIVVNHMEPDHCQTLLETLERYPNCKMVGNATTFRMFEQFYNTPKPEQYHQIKEGDEICLGKHTLVSYTMPMVHWPEVMAVYEESNKMVFSADAFGTFGAFSGNIFSDEMNFFEEWLPEARRYYTNIVGKYGVQTVNLLKKLSDFEVNYICPLHGPIWRDKDLIAQFIEKYKIWASYAPEDNAVVIFYGTIYGATEDVATLLAGEIAKLGVKNIKMYDVSATDTSYLVSEAFRAKTLVFAAASYNAGLFPYMNILLDDLKEHSIQNRNVVLIENGSWALSAGKRMSDFISGMKNMTLLADTLSIKSSLKDEQLPVIYELARKIKDSL